MKLANQECQRNVRVEIWVIWGDMGDDCFLLFCKAKKKKKESCVVVLHHLHLIFENWKEVFTVQKYTAPNFQNSKKSFFFYENFDLLKIWQKVYFRSQILERPSIGEYWNISGVLVLPENVMFTFFRTCWCYSKLCNTGMQKWSSIVQYSCTSIWDLKYTFSKICFKLLLSTCLHFNTGLSFLSNPQSIKYCSASAEHIFVQYHYRLRGLNTGLKLV